MHKELLARATFKAIDVQLDSLRAVTARMLASLGRSEVILYDLIDDDPFLELLPAPQRDRRGRDEGDAKAQRRTAVPLLAMA